MTSNNSVVRMISWIAGVVAFAITLIIPLGYFTLSYQIMRGSLESEAEINGRIISRLINDHPEMWQYQQERLMELLERRPRSGEKEVRRIVDLRGEVIAESVNPLTPPLIKKSSELKDAGVTVARLEIIRSLLPTLGATALMFLFGASIGALVFVPLRILPIRAVTRAEKMLHAAQEERVRNLQIIREIEKQQAKEQLEYQASHDALTDLPNRNLLADRIQQALLHSQRQKRQVALLFLGLDHFKFINDSLGHDAGDKLLKIVAQRLTDCVRSDDTLARQGGDCFAVVVSELTAGEDAAKVARKIQEAVSRPFSIDGHDLEISCSIGISIFPKDGEDVQALLKNADSAMFRAKEQGRNNFQFFTSELNDRNVAHMTMEKGLRRALERDEFLLHYQPQVDLNTGLITGMEALLRWENPELGLVPPGRFIPLAEDTGLIVPIGEWVMREACSQNKAWQDAGLGRYVMAVNLSARQFLNKELAEFVGGTLRGIDLDPQFLEIEIVESMVMHDVESAAAILMKLKGLGVRLSMDDFGTGYSSLSYLQRFPFNKLKIDLSFVREITTDPGSAAIARTIIAMAHALNLRVVAEGVETEGQLEYLRSHSCDEMQGFYFSRPLPVQEMEQLLQQQQQQQQQQPLRFPAKEPANPERTLLVVDDEENVLAALTRVLQEEGYRVLSADNAARGLELLAANRVGVVLCDLRMPVMNGIDFLSRVREMYPGAIRIAMSAYADMEAVIDAVNRGDIYKFLTKPWDVKQLRQSIREAFGYCESNRGKCDE